MKSPKVTVLMSAYNSENYLREAIDSILNQTFKDFEFLIINDGSTDRTAEILQSYPDYRIKVINNERNIGLTKSLNKGLKMARGKYIARQDADDISMPERFRKEIDFLEAHPDYAVVGTFAKILNEDSEVVHLWNRPIEDAQIREFFRRDNCILHGSVMIRKTSLHDVGLYDESIARAQDYDLWLRLSEKYRLTNIPEYLYLWRKHDENIGTKHREDQKRCVEIAKAKARERQLVALLTKVKSNSIDVEYASKLLVNTFLIDNMVSERYKLLKEISLFIRNITFKRINLFRLSNNVIKIRFSRRINRILRDFQIKRISFEDAKLSLRDIINR